MSDTIWTVYFFIFGLIFGSFANVVALRYPLGESLLSRSRCNGCNKIIRWWDNIPCLSWILLRAKCRNCKVYISLQYPVVELVMGFLFGATFYKYGWSFITFEVLVFIFFSLISAVIDFKHYILPDLFTLGGIIIGLLGALISPSRSFSSALIGALVGGGVLYAIAYLYLIVRKKDGMGGGDIKLLGWIGALTGFMSLPFVIIVASFTGTGFAVLRGAFSRYKMTDAIPFGPFLIGATYAYLLIDGPTIVQWYFEFIGFQ